MFGLHPWQIAGGPESLTFDEIDVFRKHLHAAHRAMREQQAKARR